MSNSMLGWKCYEKIGIGIINARSISVENFYIGFYKAILKRRCSVKNYLKYFAEIRSQWNKEIEYICDRYLRYE